MGSLFSRHKKNKDKPVPAQVPGPASIAVASGSDAVLDDIVDRYMKDDLINNPAIPDWIERRMYKNVLKMTIGIMSDTINNSEFEVLGHVVSLNIRPKSGSS